MEGDESKGSRNLLIATVYIIFGIAILGMCFQLMQDEFIGRLSLIAQKIGAGSSEETADSFEKDDGKYAINSNTMIQDNSVKSSENEISHDLEPFDNNEVYKSVISVNPCKKIDEDIPKEESNQMVKEPSVVSQKSSNNKIECEENEIFDAITENFWPLDFQNGENAASMQQADKNTRNISQLFLVNQKNHSKNTESSC